MLSRTKTIVASHSEILYDAVVVARGHIVFAWGSLSLAMPVHGGLHLLLDQSLHQVRADNVLPEPLLLQQLEVPQRRAREGQVFKVRRTRPVLEIVQVGDKGGLAEELLRSEVVEVEGVRERLNKLVTIK